MIRIGTALRPAVFREVVEEVYDLNTHEARELLRRWSEMGFIVLSWDGKIVVRDTLPEPSRDST